MKHIYLKTIFAALLLLCSSVASAHDFEVDGIFYDITDATAKTVEVTYKGNSYSEYNEYSGSVIIPSTVSYNSTVYDVTTIGDYAFRNCTGLTSIEIPGSVTSIGEDAFNNCSGLTNVTIPNSVASIGYYAFRNCTGLTSVTIPNSVTTIGASAFSGCTSLTSIEIPGSVTSIGNSAFYNCTGLTNVTIPNSVTRIGNSAFYNCSGLTNVTIPNSVTRIGNSAFYNCSGLTSVTIPNSVTTIGDDAFERCTGLTSATIGSGVTKIGSSAFNNCTGLTAVHINDLAAWCRIYFSDDYSNPLFYAYNLYLNGEKVTDLVIPNSVTSIRDQAFRGCSGLTSIEIPNSVTSIGDQAFRDCSGLTSIEIPGSVTTIGDCAFYNCDSLKNAIINEGVTTIGIYAFQYCEKLNCITLPSSLLEIGLAAISHCGYSELIIPENVTTIGDYAFDHCTALTKITIPASVTSIGARILEGCESLTSIIVDKNNTTYDSREDCNAIIESATNTLMVGCKNSTIPNSVTSIGSYAFRGCTGLTSIEIPNSVTSIGYRAFYGCDGLKEIYSLAKTPPTINSSTFDDYTATLYVPYGTKSAYQAANYWKYITNIVEMEPEFATGDINGDNEVNVGDFAALVNVIFASEVDEAQQARADINEDGEVNVGDFAALVNLIFGSSSNAAPNKAAATRATTGEHRLYIEPFNIAPGERAEIAVLMENTGDKFSQMQFDLTLPEGISIVQEFDEELFGDVPLIKHGSRTSSKAYDITCRPEGDGVKIMCATENINAYFLRESGDVLLITVEAAADLAFGTYELTISNSVLARQDDSTYKPASETAEITVCDLTGIDSIEAEDGAAEIYDIYGRRVTEPVKGGVYIINGKKVVVE